VPDWHPEHTDFNPDDIILAHDLPLHMLMNAIGHVGLHLLEEPELDKIILVGARTLPVLDGNEPLIPGELVLAFCDCMDGETGTFTLLSDTAIVECLANGEDLRVKYPRFSSFAGTNGRMCYVVPGDDQTKAPWHEVKK
jgi:hypothetical protein